ncbi:glutathione synthase [Ammoniphilus oxalaticus]|uniref:Glutathione synthase n=1 Tax=Ammoniphilus oxalaticus TaxID=66863 RepID=A0A419SK48_9BACL|nr:YheC/YheD family protein [Ammoniphilus oxalaticus]RKD24345.1 glutathione synthase [Ammoniphilus oxalaticus]
MTKPIIGILTWREGARFEEPGYLRRLIQAAEKLGATAYVFAYQDVHLEKRIIRGFTPVAVGRWQTQTYPWPDVVIDRCRKGVDGYLQLRKQKELFTYANSSYTNKWNATQLFAREESLQRWIPKTVAYSPNQLAEMLNQFRIVYLKPGNGTGGRSILKIEQKKDGFHLLGRAKNLTKKSAHFRSKRALLNRLKDWVEREKIRNGPFMIQQGLDLSLMPQRVSDTRLLIQKDEHGNWQVTGLGARVGPIGSPTSNLQGGGKPLPFKKLMLSRFGPEKTELIYEECQELAMQVVQVIEQYFGSMLEFGLDIGIDVGGKIWLIEVNPKPGREIFKTLGHKQLYRKSIERPIQYAMHLAQTNKETVITSDNIMPVQNQIDASDCEGPTTP